MPSANLLSTFVSLAMLAAVPCPAQDKAEDSIDAIELMERAILYHPRKYDPGLIRAFESSGGVRIRYKTELGEQSAWLIKDFKEKTPERLWVFCGGNATLALELSSLARSLKFDKDAFLLVDYPGYGECEGLASPAGIRQNMKASVLAVCGKLALDAKQLPRTARVFGYSLGCAAALLAVEEFELQAAVLCAPFTSTIEMAQARLRVAKDFPLKHKFDNRAGLKVLTTNKGKAWIFHGDRDNIIPVQMSKTLQDEFKDTVKLKVVSDGSHHDVISKARKEFIEAMAEARKMRE